MYSQEDLEALKNDEWYKTRPDIIKQAIDILPPTQIYQFKDSKKQCYIISYEEPDLERTDTNMFKEVTVTVQKIGEGGPMAAMGLGSLDTNRVFGVKLTDLEPVNN